MAESTLPEVYLVRHGETEWSAKGKHTGRKDIPLTPAGEAAAIAIAERLKGLDFGSVWSSPSSRARLTGELAGYGERLEILDDLAEWDYGDYEGMTTREIRDRRSDWRLFRDGCPNGETAADVAARADYIIGNLRKVASRRALVFSSAHFLRVLAARWLGLPADGGRLFVLDTASVSVLGYDHDLTEPVIRRWNQR